MYKSEFWGIIILTILLALSNVSGIGGGGIIIPVTMTCFQFSTKEAIALSGFMILAGALARFLYNYNDLHPEKNAVIIDYNLVIVMLPLVLVGSFMGVVINIMMPGIILSGCLTIILITLALQSLFKANAIYAKENR